MLPIEPRRVVTVCVLALLVLSATPVANAQLPELQLEVAPAEAEATPGSPVLFDVLLRNAGLVDATVALAARDASAGWNATFANATLVVPAEGEARTTLTFTMPADAAPGDAGTLLVDARHDGTDVQAAPAQRVNVTVVAPPAREASGPGALPPAKLALLAAASVAPPGAPATGTLQVYNGDTRSVYVELAIGDATSWRGRFDTIVVTYRIPAGESAHVPLAADVPHAAAQNETREVRVTATEPESGATFAATWLVRAQGEPVAAPAQGEPADESSPASEPAANESGTTEASAPTVEAELTKLLVEVAVGGSDRTLLRLANPTLDPLTLRLSSEAPPGWTLTFAQDVVALAPGAAQDVEVRVTAPADAIPGGLGEAAVLVQPDGLAAQRLAFQVEPVDAAIAPGEADASDADVAATATLDAPRDTGALVPVAVGLGAVGAGALAFTHRPWRERILWGAAGLYTRLLRPDVLAHEERERLHTLIGAQPGIHFHALQRELGWNTGTLTYHLRVLERHSFITSRRDGQLRRFYHVGNAPRKELFEGPSGLRADVLEAVRGQPGISQSDLTLALGANKQTVNYHVKALERQGLLRIEKRGRDTFLFVLADVPVTRPESASA